MLLSRVIAAVAVVVIVFAVVIPATPMVTAIVPAAVPAVVRMMITGPVRAATPVIGFAMTFVMSVFFVNAMVPVLVVIVAMDMRPRRISRRVIGTLVLVMSTMGWFAGVAVGLRGIAEG
jgi:hypothetical protein